MKFEKCIKESPHKFALCTSIFIKYNMYGGGLQGGTHPLNERTSSSYILIKCARKSNLIHKDNKTSMIAVKGKEGIVVQ